MPKTEISRARAPRAVSKKVATRSDFQCAVDLVSELTPRDRARLIAKFRKQFAAAGRALLIKEVKQAKLEIARGDCFEGTMEEVIRELNDD